jgi:KDO2-lipid IV(A) lauroyltransferase
VESTLSLSEEAETEIGEALAQKKGVVFVTAHLGPMERMAGLVASRGYPVATLARESYDPRFTALYEHLRSSRGVCTIYRGRASSAYSILKRLRQGYLVGFPMDFAGRGMQCGTFEFLGGMAALPLGPATIALRTGAPVMVGTPALGKDGDLHVSVKRMAIEPGLDEFELTRRLGAELEGRIRALPAHWPWMHSGDSA